MNETTLPYNEQLSHGKSCVFKWFPNHVYFTLCLPFPHWELKLMHILAPPRPHILDFIVVFFHLSIFWHLYIQFRCLRLWFYFFVCCTYIQENYWKIIHRYYQRGRSTTKKIYNCTLYISIDNCQSVES